MTDRNLKMCALCFAMMFFTNVMAQNMLPTDWQIDFHKAHSVSTRGARQHSIVSTLLSWERQGYFAGDGDCTLSTKFDISDTQLQYVLKVKMQCDISRIEINGKQIADTLKNQFWTDKNVFSTFVLPKGILVNGENEIRIECSELGYTGGMSYTMIDMRPVDSHSQESLRMSLPTANHVSLSDSHSVVTLHYHASKRGAIRMRVENDFHKQLLDSTIAVKQGNSSIAIDLSRTCREPGFYQLTATMHAFGYSSDVQWLAVKPEKVKCDTRTVAGFSSYWTWALDELSAVKPQFTMQRSDSLSAKSRRDVYIVGMKSTDGVIVRGYYFVPRDGACHRAVLQVPGYGWGFEDITGMLNDDTDRIELALCVRGHGLSRDVFNPGFGMPGVWGYKLYDRDSVSYRGIYMDCVRGVDFLCSRKEVDAARIAVKGGSQGGGLALATAALCRDRIAALAYFDPFPCDMRHQIQIRTTCETELKNDLAYYGNPCTFADVMAIQDLIDSRSFAPMITCPTLYTAALQDDDCPVHGGFTAYNLMKSPKEYVVFPHDGHIEGFTHDAMIMHWLDKTLGKTE